MNMNSKRVGPKTKPCGMPCDVEEAGGQPSIHIHFLYLVINTFLHIIAKVILPVPLVRRI